MKKKQLPLGIASFLFFILFFWGLARFCHYQTKGFRLSKISHNTSCFHQTSPNFPKNLQDIMHQKFYFFGRGKQNFSFLSEDKKFVLKLFNNRYQNRLFWLRYFPLQKNITYNKEKWEKTFKSYQIASEQLSEETGLLFFHPAQSEDCPKVTLIDPLNIAHQIDLNQYAFAIQKKALLAYPYFEECAKKKDFIKAAKGFHSLFSLFKYKMDLGIADNDPLIRTNFGFYEDKAIQIDLGPFSFNEELKSLKKQKEEIKKIALPLQHWLESNHPELLPLFYDTLNIF